VIAGRLVTKGGGAMNHRQHGRWTGSTALAALILMAAMAGVASTSHGQQQPPPPTSLPPTSGASRPQLPPPPPTSLPPAHGASAPTPAVAPMRPAAGTSAPPRVMILIDEKVSGIYGTTGFESVGQAESTLAEQLTAAGFTVVDPQTVRLNLARDKALRLVEGDQQAAAVTGLQFGAQIVITGQAISKNAGSKLLGTNMQTLQATVQARAITSDDGRVLATRTAQASKAHIDELLGGAQAIKEASREVADGMVADLRAAWSRQAMRSTQSLTLMIAGLVSYRHLTAVKQYLETGLPGVSGVDVRQFAQGSAELAVDFAGKSTAIAEDLANRKFTGFRLEPISVTPNRIDIQAVVDK